MSANLDSDLVLAKHWREVRKLERDLEVAFSLYGFDHKGLGVASLAKYLADAGWFTHKGTPANDPKQGLMFEWTELSAIARKHGFGLQELIRKRRVALYRMEWLERMCRVELYSYLVGRGYPLTWIAVMFRRSPSTVESILYHKRKDFVA